MDGIMSWPTFFHSFFQPWFYDASDYESKMGWFNSGLRQLKGIVHLKKVIFWSSLMSFQPYYSHFLYTKLSKKCKSLFWLKAAFTVNGYFMEKGIGFYKYSHFIFKEKKIYSVPIWNHARTSKIWKCCHNFGVNYSIKWYFISSAIWPHVLKSNSLFSQGLLTLTLGKVILWC